MPEENTTAQNQKKGGGKKKVIIVTGVIVVLLAVIGVLLFLLLYKPPVEDEGPRRDVVAPDSVEDFVTEIEESTLSDIPQSYIVTQNSDWIFPSADQPTINAYIENDEDNETAVYFDLILASTGEVIYSSPVLERGARLEGFTLTKPLENGSYECYVEYHLIDEDQNTLTTSTVGVTIQVGS